MPEAFAVGPVLIPTLRTTVVLSLMLAIWFAKHVARRMDLEVQWVGRTAEVSAWLGLIGARLGFVINNWSAFDEAPWTALYIWQPGYSPIAGLLVGAGCVAWRVWRRNVSERSVYAQALVGSFILAALLPVSAVIAMQIKINPGMLQKGDRVPAFTLQDLEGIRVSVADLKGQALVLNFWATWCPPCRREMPLLDDVQKKYASRGLMVIGIDLDEPVDVAKAYVSSIGVTYPIWVDPRSNDPGFDQTRELYNRFGGIGLPTTVFVDPKGVIQDRYMGELNRAFLQNRVEAILPR